MYIPEFYCGIAATLATEIVILFAAAAWQIHRDRRMRRKLRGEKERPVHDARSIQQRELYGRCGMEEIENRMVVDSEWRCLENSREETERPAPDRAEYYDRERGCYVSAEDAFRYCVEMLENAPDDEKQEFVEWYGLRRI